MLPCMLRSYATHYNTPATCVRKAAALPADWFQPLGRPPESNKTVCTGGQGAGQGTCTHDSGAWRVGCWQQAAPAAPPDLVSPCLPHALHKPPPLLRCPAPPSGSPLLYSQLLPWGKRRHSLLGVLSWGVGEGGGWGSECSQGSTAMDWWASLLHPAHRQWLAQQLAALGHQALVDSWNALR